MGQSSLGPEIGIQDHPTECDTLKIKRISFSQRGASSGEDYPMHIFPKHKSCEADYESPNMCRSLVYDDSPDKRQLSFANRHCLYNRLFDWFGKKRRKPPRHIELHTRVLYDTKISHDYRRTRGKFAALRRATKGGSFDEARRLLAQQQESGYSSPNMSAQPTPTAPHRLANNPSFMRRSLELCVPKSASFSKPRMSLPAEHIRRTIDGRFSAPAAERRRRLSRGKPINQDDGISPSAPTHISEIGEITFPIISPNKTFATATISHLPSTMNTVVTSRRMSRPGSSSREESTGEESGFEEEEPIEIRVPPLVVEERRDSNTSSNQAKESNEPLREWIIPYDQLKFGHILRKGNTTNIYRGRWHGDVMIHIFDGGDEATEKHFWGLVTNLSMIRHENIVLFMGACMTLPNLAIVTGVRRGMSLHQHTIVRGSLPYGFRVNIARQMAQAMSYLHSRGITHGKLNSRNVFLEAKIKLSLLDHSMAESLETLRDYGCLAQGLLPYHPPEMIKSVVISSAVVQFNYEPTPQTDAFMYGTLLYELFAEKLPYEGEHPHSIIYQIGLGLFVKIHHLHCASAIKNVLQDCWKVQSNERPTFASILQTLQQSLSVHKTHSTSEPERLNKVGQQTRLKS